MVNLQRPRPLDDEIQPWLAIAGKFLTCGDRDLGPATRCDTTFCSSWAPRRA